MSDNSQSKSMLAKLLATENITIRRNANARTASFDIKNRVLEMPVWKGVSEDLEDLLTVHETGHALDTPAEGWMDALKSIAGKYHEKPSNRHTMAIKGFLNVIEDARIDKRQKRRYPGSRRNYLAGYKELLERGFFGPVGTDFNTYNFIDRINVYFKGGVSLGIKFSPEEMPFVKRIENAETWNDVLILADEVYGYCKAKGENQNRQTLDDMEYEESEDGDEFDDYEIIESDEESEDGEEGKSFPGTMNADGDADEDGDEESKSSRGEGDTEDGETEKSQNDLKNEGRSGEVQDDDFVPESQTEKTWQEKQLELSDTSSDWVYVTIPKPNISKIVDDYKVVLSQNETYNSTAFESDYRATIAKDFSNFKNAENNTISFMVKEFEMRKSADMYSKISIAKTGVIDTNKLHSYRYNDDIFRRLATVPQGKNHGFIMFLDWSGSMQPYFKNTIKQLISMVLFCKRVQIPFEVYSFRDLNGNEVKLNESVMIARSKQADDYFEFKNGDMMLASLKLRNLLSSRMSLAELNRAFVNLWTCATNHYSNLEPLNGTPLNAAIIAATELVNQFRNTNKLQIVNTIFLTDGGSNPILGRVGEPRGYDYDRHLAKKRTIYILQDEMTKKEYSLGGSRIDGDILTNNLLRSLKERTGCNLIGFYLYSHSYGRAGTRAMSVYTNFYGNVSNQKHYEEMSKLWNEHKFMPVTSAGYDDYYIIDANSLYENQANLRVDSSMTKNRIAKAFLTFSAKKAVNRILLQRFINLTSTTKKAA